ncbi:uncharacterized protein BX663DRAFT_525614 [Cokeromyces recurvatus]|uniref:uncharacterized protein n=1 Tax=Cokeromyces recurvatus TaxID=90255 RepID=UPI00221F4A06|nr:uncharacterized protein BX663DRAFT_525614 [Cokeromyces recurvatus]KAI7898219.1 hypothetical protein BX663DRAFT_525614 [Cokeromyces recurvatus]
MLFKKLSLLLLASVTLACEMDCRRGVSKDLASFYVPVIKDTIQSLQSQLVASIDKINVPALITNKVDKNELMDDMQQTLTTTLDDFVTMASAPSRLAEGFYQVIFNEELPYKGDCNNPKRLDRKMPKPGESWTMEECRKMDYRCGNPPSICYFLEDVKGRCVGRMKRQLTEYASFDNGQLVKELVINTRRSVYKTLSNYGEGKLSETSQVEDYLAKVISSMIRTLDSWVTQDVKELCNKPTQDELCNGWDDEIRREILKWP